MSGPFKIDGSATVRFGCRECGRCCGTPPQMSVKEAMRLADDFPLQASFVSIPYGMSFPGPNGESMALTRARSEALGGYRSSGYDVVGTQREFVTTLSADALYSGATGRCPSLRPDGRCGIYERRPAVCRYIPAQHLLPSDRQDRALEMFYRDHSGDCDWTEAAPVILKGGRIVDGPMAAALDEAEEDERRDNAVLRLLAQHGHRVASIEDEADLSIAGLIEASMRAPSMDVPLVVIVMFLAGLREAGMLPDGYGEFDLKDIARRQAEACERMIQDNLRRKNRDDRLLTAELRALKEVNLMVANENL